MSALPAEFELTPISQVTPQGVEERLHSANLFAARLQLFVSSALVWLIFIFSTLSSETLPAGPTLLITGWLVATTLALSYLALRGDRRFLTGPLPGRIALLTTLVTVLLAAYLIHDAFGDFYHVYFFPIAVATIYYGVRGGIPTAILCAISYVFLALGLSPTPLTAATFSLLVERVVFLIALAGTIGVAAEGGLALTRELRSAFADLKATAISLEETRGSLTRRVREAAALDQVAREITSTLETERVLRLVLEEVKTALDVEASTLMTLDVGTQELVFQIPLGEKGAELQGYRLPVGQGVAGRVARDRQPLRIDDVEQDPRHFQSVDRQSGFRTRSILAVPMLLQERVTGVLEVMNKRVGGFTRSDERLLISVAQWAAIALENARLYQDLQARMEELRLAQEQLVRAERLRALGEMAGGVAHDFNNLLTIIMAESQILSVSPRTPSEQHSLQRIEQAARDGAHAVRRILEYARVRRDTPQQVVDVNDLVAQVVEMTKPRWDGVAHVKFEPQLSGAVLGNAGELREVLTNLVWNAVDARVDGRPLKIMIRTARVGDSAIIEVEDNGSGIPPEIRARIFDPYFTTKRNGTGLGLSIAYGMIARHGGQIQVTSLEKGNGGRPYGTCFTIHLPLTTHSTEAPVMKDQIWQKRFSRILLVDDEPDLVAAASSLLRASGYEVSSAQTAVDAEAQVSKGQFDVLMTDLTMPDCTGWDLALRSKELWPHKPVVLVTGWGLQLDAKQMNAGKVDGVLSKPFTLQELHQTLDNLP